MLAPLLLGLAGSMHCVGMCGPLMLALPLDAAGKRQVWRQMLLYHSGRILTYVLLGVFFGLAGKGLALAGLQKALSISAGVLLILMAFAAWRFERLVTALPGFSGFTQRIQNGMGRLMRRHSGGGVFYFGLLNGLLPCGMVYAALAAAIATTGGAAGGLFMALFGVGTLPLLLTMSVLGRSLPLAVRRIRVLQPVLITIAGLVLLQRGLHLDLSLFEAAVPKAGMECH